LHEERVEGSKDGDDDAESARVLRELAEQRAEGGVQLAPLPAELRAARPGEEARLGGFDRRFRQAADGEGEAGDHRAAVRFEAEELREQREGDERDGPVDRALRALRRLRLLPLLRAGRRRRRRREGGEDRGERVVLGQRQRARRRDDEALEQAARAAADGVDLLDRLQSMSKQKKDEQTKEWRMSAKKRK
jgi:hypothetical protein